MIKRFYRWALRILVTAAVLMLLAALSDYFTHRVSPGSVMVVSLEGPVVERGRTGVPGVLIGPRQTPLNVVRHAIHMAARDARIAGLAIKVVDPEIELAQAQELAAMIGEFARHRKWTAAYIETAGEFEPGNLPYLVASAAGQVSILPQGELNLVGVQMREIFLRGTLDWLGIKPNFESIGAYKTAANIFTQKDFTPAQREADESLVESLFGQIVGQIARQRRIDPATVRGLIDRAPLTAAAGLKAGLVDRIEYEDQFDERLKTRGGVTHALLDYAAYARPRILPGLPERDRIALIYGSGEIERGPGGFDPLSPGGTSMGSDKMEQAFKQAREDDNVRAVVFRINSPGGSVIGSELIRRQVELTAKRKPVVVSMSGYAASGGYWVATPAARIVADPGTITGSIGVLGGKFNVAPMATKLGVNSGTVARGANVGMFDAFTDFTPAQQRILQEQLLGDTYTQFVKLVADGRHLSVEQVERVAQGRVWSGEQALGIKLVDTLGNLDAALNEAKAQAHLPAERPVSIIELPPPPSLLQQLLGGGRDASMAPGPALAAALRPWKRLVGAALKMRGVFGELYCSRIPVM